LLLAIRVPVLSDSARWVYRKFCRKLGEFAQSIVAIVYDPARNYGCCVLGAAADKPVVLPALSKWLTERSSVDTAAMPDTAARMDADPAGIERPDAKSYAYQLHRPMLTRAVRELLDS